METIEGVINVVLYLLLTYWKWWVGIGGIITLLWIESHIRGRRVRRMGIPVSAGGDLMYPYVTEAVAVYFILLWNVEFMGNFGIASMILFVALWVRNLDRKSSAFTGKVEERLEELTSRLDEAREAIRDLQGQNLPRQQF